MSDELEAYKRRIVGVYDRAAVDYGQWGPALFRYAGRRLVELAEIPAEARVLDVATGRGAVLFPAAERVGPSGHVLGVDLSDAMVRETSAEIARRRLSHAEVRLMDAEQLDLPEASLDFVFCSFAVFFFAHLDRVLSQFWQILRPSGQVGIALAEEIDPRWGWQNELFRKYATFESTPSAIRGAELRKPGVLARLLGEAGFVDVRELTEDAELIAGSAEDWLASLWTHGTRRAMESMTSEGLERFQAEAKVRLRELEQAGPLAELCRFRFTLAHRPSVR